jgi:hypothetical protein
VLDLLTEQEDKPVFDMFQTPDNLILRRLPDEMEIKLTSSQGAVLLKLVNKAAVMDPDTYRDLYLRVQSATTGGGIIMGTNTTADLCLSRDETMKLLSAIKLTDAKLINTRLGVRDALWALRQKILQRIGIQEVN